MLTVLQPLQLLAQTLQQFEVFATCPSVAPSLGTDPAVTPPLIMSSAVTPATGPVAVPSMVMRKSYKFLPGEVHCARRFSPVVTPTPPMSPLAAKTSITCPVVIPALAMNSEVTSTPATARQPLQLLQ